METKNQATLAKPFEPTLSIIKASWDILKSKPWQFAAFEIFPVIPIIVFGIIASLLFAFFVQGSEQGSSLPALLSGQEGAFAGQVASQLHSGQVITLFALAGLGLLSAILFALWMSAAKILFLKEYQAGTTFSLSLKKSLSFIAGFAWVRVLQGLITFVGYILFIIPGIYFTFKYFFSHYVFVVESTEGVRGKRALKRSSELTHGFWWGLLSRTVALSLYIVLAQVILSIVTDFASGAATLSDSKIAVVVVGVLAVCISMAVGIALQALGSIFQYKLFEHVYYTKKDVPDAIHPFAAAKRIGFVVIAVLFIAGFFVMSVMLALQATDTGAELNSNAPEPLLAVPNFEDGEPLLDDTGEQGQTPGESQVEQGSGLMQ